MSAPETFAPAAMPVMASSSSASLVSISEVMSAPFVGSVVVENRLSNECGWAPIPAASGAC